MGRYIWGHEVNSFQPTASPRVYWVAGESATMRLLEERYRKLTTRPYGPVFLRATGTVGPVPPDARDGFAGDYDALFTLDKVEETRALRVSER